MCKITSHFGKMIMHLGIINPTKYFLNKPKATVLIKGAKDQTSNCKQSLQRNNIHRVQNRGEITENVKLQKELQ